MRITLFAALLCGSLLCGCGQKGPLFIPSEAPTPSQPSSSNQ
jgi:predicted small lipoprotein YifL